jgi:iron complex outermembrane receptor protein
MKRILFFVTLILIYSNTCLQGQEGTLDSAKTIGLQEVVITANRLPVTLKTNPGAVSLVTKETMAGMPKGIAVEEALRLVPGVRIDNQHDAERVHVSIRGQGILTERGLRGVGVIIDGIPVNDPSGFAPDLYDVDWAAIKKIEVVRGPAAGLYGSGGSAGVLNIVTSDGEIKPAEAGISQAFGSNGFFKTRVQLSGKEKIVNYRFSYSHSGGKGYRDHQAFRSNKFSEKVSVSPSDKLSLTQIMTYTDYFQQNPEGLNLSQFDNLRQSNPDARPFNEYQKTIRTTAGLSGKYKINSLNDINAIAYFRSGNYKETSNKCAEYRTISNPGAEIQYNLHFLTGPVKQNLSAGADLKWQSSSIFKIQSASDPFRIENIDDTNIETDSLLANQVISQSSSGLFFLYKADIGNLIITGDIRYDVMKNLLKNKLSAPDSAKTTKNFSRTSLKIGASYSITEALTIFSDWSQGFLPPSTEELASNPSGYSGFNTHLIPSTSSCYELGTRGFFGSQVNYELTAFLMNTKNDFFRFKQTGRGNQEVFYGNAGNSRRFGIESSVSLNLFKHLDINIAYTYARYRYTSATIDPVYTDPDYVLTAPPEAGQYLPNSPQHQLYAEIEYKISGNFKVVLGSESQSKWAIYTDANAYKGELDPDIYRNWQRGFTLFNFNFLYNFNIHGLKSEISFSARNLTDDGYMAFTEPDPDGNSYHPGPGREFFGKITVLF